MKIDDFESSVSDIIENCQPYLKLTGFKFSNIPLRSFDYSYDSENGVQKQITIKHRNGVMSNGLTRDIIQNTFKEKNIASRYDNVVICSSLGMNTSYPMSQDSMGYVIPIGEFSYAYTKNDFNNGGFRRITNYFDEIHEDFDDMLGKQFLEVKPLIDDFRNKIEHVSLFGIKDLLEHLFTGIKQKIPDDGTHDNLNALQNKFNNVIDTIIDNYFGNGENIIHTDNIQDAFKSENEIWFNCSHFYSIGQHNVYVLNELKKYFQ